MFHSTAVYSSLFTLKALDKKRTVQCFNTIDYIWVKQTSNNIFAHSSNMRTSYDDVVFTPANVISWSDNRLGFAKNFTSSHKTAVTFQHHFREHYLPYRIHVQMYHETRSLCCTQKKHHCVSSQHSFSIWTWCMIFVQKAKTPLWGKSNVVYHNTVHLIHTCTQKNPPIWLHYSQGNSMVL